MASFEKLSATTIEVNVIIFKIFDVFEHMFVFLSNAFLLKTMAVYKTICLAMADWSRHEAHTCLHGLRQTMHTQMVTFVDHILGYPP